MMAWPPQLPSEPWFLHSSNPLSSSDHLDGGGRSPADSMQQRISSTRLTVLLEAVIVLCGFRSSVVIRTKEKVVKKRVGASLWLDMEGREEGTSTVSGLKKKGLSFLISMQESWQYIKSIFTGQVRRARARSEQEASEADLQTAKMQVEAADAAEEKKKRLTM